MNHSSNVTSILSFFACPKMSTPFLTSMQGLFDSTEAKLDFLITLAKEKKEYYDRVIHLLTIPIAHCSPTADMLTKVQALIEERDELKRMSESVAWDTERFKMLDEGEVTIVRTVFGANLRRVQIQTKLVPHSCSVCGKKTNGLLFHIKGLDLSLLFQCSLECHTIAKESWKIDQESLSPSSSSS